MWLGHYHSWNLKHWCHWAVIISTYATEDHANVVGPSVLRELETLCWRGHLYLRILRRLCGLAITIYGTGDTAVTLGCFRTDFKTFFCILHSLYNVCMYSIITVHKESKIAPLRLGFLLYLNCYQDQQLYSVVLSKHSSHNHWQLSARTKNLEPTYVSYKNKCRVPGVIFSLSIAAFEQRPLSLFFCKHSS